MKDFVMTVPKPYYKNAWLYNDQKLNDVIYGWPLIKAHLDPEYIFEPFKYHPFPLSYSSVFMMKFFKPDDPITKLASNVCLLLESLIEIKIVQDFLSRVQRPIQSK
jgi:hypothetical protein